MNIFKKIIISSITFFSFAINLNALTNIIIDKGSLVPYFNKTIHKYNLFVSEDTEYINISFIKESTDDYITGGGKITLKRGENILNIVVNKTDGSKDEYIINVSRGYKVIKDYSSATLKKLEIKGYNINFDSNVYEYNIDIEENVTELTFDYEATSEYAKVILEGNSNLNKSENKIYITVSSHDEKITNVYTITVNKLITTFNEETNEKKISRSFTREEKILTIIGVSIVAISLIYFIYRIMFKKKKKNKR
jgi:hypothetical protein